MAAPWSKWTNDPTIKEQHERQFDIVQKENTLTKEELEQYNAQLQKMYSDQCFLMTFAARLKEQLPIPAEDQTEYAILNGDPGLVINHLAAKKSIKEFLTIRPDQLSSLVPKIEIYKVFYNKKKEGEDFPFNFSNYTNIENITKNNFSRGDGAGIKDVQITLEGKDPATKNIVDVKVQFFFQDIKYFFAKQDVGGGRTMSLAHLITYPTNPENNAKKADTLYKFENIHDPGMFRIKMVVGWQTPKDTMLLSKALKGAVKETQLIMMLDLQDHQIDFANDGSVRLNVHYRGAIENAFYSQAADIMRLDNSQLDTIIETKRRMEKLKKEVGEINTKIKDLAHDIGHKKFQAQKKGPDDLVAHQPQHFIDQAEKDLLASARRKKEDIQGLATGNQGFAVQHFFADIGETTLYFFDVTETEIDTINAAVSMLGLAQRDQPTSLRNLDAALDDKVREIFNSLAGGNRITIADRSYDPTQDAAQSMKDLAAARKLQNQDVIKDVKGSAKKKHLRRLREQWDYKSPDGNFRRIAFIKLGDVINNLLKKVGPAVAEQWKMNNLTMMMGPLRFTDMISRKNVYLNLAEVPIDIRVFNNFLAEKVIGEGRSSYFFQEFLEDLIGELIHTAMDSCIHGKTGANLSNIELLPLTAAGSGPNGVGRIEPGKKYNVETLARMGADLPYVDHAPVSNLHNYLLLYASGWEPAKLTGNYSEDINRNIYHFVVGGPDSGILKNISFGQANNPTWAVANYAQLDQEKNVTGVIKPESFVATITTVGNTLFQLGQQIYIDSTFIDGGASNVYRLAFGGYYSIIKLSSAITETDYVTTIQAKLTVPDWTVRAESSGYSEMTTTVVGLKESQQVTSEGKIEDK